MENSVGFGAFIPLFLMCIALAILNGSIALRKGKSQVLYVILSLIPLVNFYIAIYLSSLMDKSIHEKVDRIIELLDSK